MENENLNSLVDEDMILTCVQLRYGKEMSSFPLAIKRNITCRINAGGVERGTPIIFESDATDSLARVRILLQKLKRKECVASSIPGLLPI